MSAICNALSQLGSRRYPTYAGLVRQAALSSKVPVSHRAAPEVLKGSHEFAIILPLCTLLSPLCRR